MRQFFKTSARRAIPAVKIRPWVPSDIVSTLILAWYDATDPLTIVSAGGFVSQWNDKSGRAMHLTQGAGTDQPQTGIRALNGKNILDFDGTDFLIKASFTSVAPSVSVFVVAVFDVIDNATDALWSLSAVKDFGFVAGNASQFNGNLVCVGASNPANTPLSGGPFPGPSIYNGSMHTSPLKIRGFVDGVMRAEVPLIGGISGTETLRIFADRTGTYKPDGAVGEVIIVKYTTDAVRQQIEGYLAWKWSLQGNLDASHPYKSAAPSMVA